jgi:transcriptional regulator with XRE-family HTH domain
MSGKGPMNSKVNEPLSAKLDRARSTAAYQAEYLKETFSDELWRAMEFRKLTQVEFAEKANVSKQFLTRVFRGSNCTIETMAKLTFALQYKIHLHLTPSEWECDWMEFLKEPPKRPESAFQASVWTLQYQVVSSIEVKCEPVSISN